MQEAKRRKKKIINICDLLKAGDIKPEGKTSAREEAKRKMQKAASEEKQAEPMITK